MYVAAHVDSCRNLADNQITSISAGAFSNLTSLQRLFVAVYHAPNGSRMTDWLLRRTLEGNQISSIADGAFTSLGNLESLFVGLVLLCPWNLRTGVTDGCGAGTCTATR